MSKENTINVFCKVVTDKDGKNFKTYSTKAPSGTYYKVKFIQECGNSHLIPNNTKPFVLVTNRLEASSKTRVNRETGDRYVDNILYIKNIIRIDEYIEPDTDFNSL